MAHMKSYIGDFSNADAKAIAQRILSKEPISYIGKFPDPAPFSSTLRKPRSRMVSTALQSALLVASLAGSHYLSSEITPSPPPQSHNQTAHALSSEYVHLNFPTNLFTPTTTSTTSTTSTTTTSTTTTTTVPPPPPTTTTAPPPPPPPKVVVAPAPVCAELFIWYGYNSAANQWSGGEGTSHWNDGAYGKVIDTPSSGYYSSLAQVPTQLQQMSSAGINCVIPVWEGPGSGDAVVQQIFAQAKAINPQMKIAILVDAFEQNPTPAQYQQIYSYVNNTFYAPNASQVLQFQGRPLLLFFNPMEPPQNPAFTVRIMGNNKNDAQWPLWQGIPQDFESYGGTISNPCKQGYCGPAISNDGVISVTPRYDDLALYQAGSRQEYMRVDFDLSRKMYENEWSYVIQNYTSVKLVLIYSWNEYHERSAIEPHTDATSNSGSTFLLDTTKGVISVFRNREAGN